MSLIAINGRFLSAATTGVQRVAAELIRGVDAILTAGPPAPPSWTLLKPKNARRSLELDNVKEQTVGLSTWQAWEQIELPWFSRQSRLLSLCNVAPLSHRDSIIMMHDAQVFTTPESYSSALRSWYRFLQPALGRRARRILTVSEFSRSELVKFGVAQERNITVIHNGIDHFASVVEDPAAYFRLGLSDSPFVVALANAQSHKNIAVLLKAFADPRLESFRLVLVGRAQAEDFGEKIPENVKFAGLIADQELKGLFAKAVCLAFPSLTEGFGLPPLEAMATGCPAVVAPCGALPEVCAKAAIYARPDQPDDWINAILGLEGSSGLRSQYVAAGKNQSAKFKWADSAQSLLKVLERD